MDGFGPAVTSIIGLLYMFVEIVAVTIFYFAVILVLQINITSAPMTCYIVMYSQLIPLWWNFAFEGEDLNISRQMFILNHKSIEFSHILILVIYDMWNLHFFHSLVPPFCISSKQKQFHFGLLGYISIFYPLVLILLTWLFIEFHN